MATVFEVAKYFLWQAGEVGELLSNLKLQKLVYYAQAWHLAVCGRELFPQDFQAWVHGPVCPDLYHAYKHYGWQPIPCVDEKPSFHGDTEQLLDQVVELYLGESPYRLEQMTHSEAPWNLARGALPPDVPSSAIISKESMKAYYEQFVVTDS